MCAFLGAVSAFFARIDAEDDKWYHFSLAYITRALNNRDANDAMVQMFFIASSASTSFRFGSSRKILATTATILTKYPNR